jgi:hypothetical protein
LAVNGSPHFYCDRAPGTRIERSPNCCSKIVRHSRRSSRNVADRSLPQAVGCAAQARLARAQARQPPRASCWIATERSTSTGRIPGSTSGNDYLSNNPSRCVWVCWLQVWSFRSPYSRLCSSITIMRPTGGRRMTAFCRSRAGSRCVEACLAPRCAPSARSVPDASFFQFIGDLLFASGPNDRDLVRRSWHSVQRERRRRRLLLDTARSEDRDLKWADG